MNLLVAVIEDVRRERRADDTLFLGMLVLLSPLWMPVYWLGLLVFWIAERLGAGA